MRQGDHGQHGEIAFTLPIVVDQQVEVGDRVAKEQKLMSKTYAIADLHGRFDLLEMALACIAKCAEPPATLVTLGDYVDRGPDSRKIIERLMAGLDRDGWRLICLKGNHEDIMWQTCRKLPDVDWWLTNGGGATLISYGQQLGDQADMTIVPAPHLDWIEQLPLIYVDRHRVFVHAGIDQNCPLDEQDAENIIWKIYPDDDDGGHGQRHVIHGHHQHAHGPIFKNNRTNLDTFAWYTGRLAIGVFDDATPGGPIEVLEVNGEPIERIPSSRWSMSPLAAKRRADEVKKPRGFTRQF
jgi:serine/threonine protein phosphatase 1